MSRAGVCMGSTSVGGGVRAWALDLHVAVRPTSFEGAARGIFLHCAFSVGMGSSLADAAFAAALNPPEGAVRGMALAAGALFAAPTSGGGVVLRGASSNCLGGACFAAFDEVQIDRQLERTWIWIVISIVSDLMQLLARQLMQRLPRQVLHRLPRQVLRPFQRWLVQPLSRASPFAASPRSTAGAAAGLAHRAQHSSACPTCRGEPAAYCRI